MTLLEGMDRFAEALRGVQRVLITTHYHPDGDAIGSSLGLRRMLLDLGKQVEVVIDDVVPAKYAFLVDGHVWRPEEKELTRMATEAPFQMVVFVDASARDRVGAVEQMLQDWMDDEPIEVNIDHHIGNESFGDVVILDPTRSSSGEIILDISRHLGVPLTPRAATQLFAAVLTDTGRFQFSNTDPRSLRTAADLVAAGADPTDIADRIYFDRPTAYFRLVGRLFYHMQLHEADRICILVMDDSTAREFFPDEIPDTEGIVDFTVQMLGVELGVFIRQVGDGIWRASLRSRGIVDVRSVAERFGGGGHEKAAGCQIEGSIDHVQEQLLDALKELVG